MPNRLASVVNIPTVVDTRHDPCSSSLSRSAPSRDGGTGAKSIVTVPHAVAWRVAFGTGAVGFLKSAVYGLRAIENPARAVALLTEMIAFQASGPFETSSSRMPVATCSRRAFGAVLWGMVTSSTGTPRARLYGHGPWGAGLVAHLESQSLLDAPL